MLKLVDDFWRWECPSCRAVNKITVRVEESAVYGSRVECAHCRAPFSIDRSLRLRPEADRQLFLVTARLDRDGKRWVIPNMDGLRVLTSRARQAAMDLDIEIIREISEERSVIVSCSSAKAVSLSRDPRVCAVAPVETP